MAFSKKDWGTGDVITEAHLDRIEQGVYDAHDLADAAQDTGDSVRSDHNSLVQHMGAAAVLYPIHVMTNADGDPTVYYLPPGWSASTVSGTPGFVKIFHTLGHDNYVVVATGRYFDTNIVLSSPGSTYFNLVAKNSAAAYRDTPIHALLIPYG